MNKNLKVGVIGSGINGIATSLALLQAFPSIDLTIYSENFSPNTTSDGAGGLWGPFIIKGTSSENVIKWSSITWNFLEARHKENKSGGVRLMPTTTISGEELESPFWKHIPYNYRELSQEELKVFGPGYINGWTYLSFTAESSIILTDLTNEVRLLGGNLIAKRLNTLMDIANDVDIIINCSGLGAYNLVPDFEMFPVRGQVMRVKCPSINFSILDVSEETFSYIIPNVSSVVLGGTHQENDWRTTVDESDSKHIWQNCTKFAPELKKCKVIKEWVGLRPVRRSGLRLEMEEISYASKVIPVIHNYGHGGSGLTLFWGCALEVKEHFRSLLHKRYDLRPKL